MKKITSIIICILILLVPLCLVYAEGGSVPVPAGQGQLITVESPDTVTYYGDSYDVYYTQRSFADRFAGNLTPALILGVIVGLITVLVLTKNMRTIAKASSASNYLDRNSFVLRNKRDIFLYRSESRVLVEQQNPSAKPRR